MILERIMLLLLVWLLIFLALSPFYLLLAAMVLDDYDLVHAALVAMMAETVVVGTGYFFFTLWASIAPTESL